jgi:hypothetical protein
MTSHIEHQTRDIDWLHAIMKKYYLSVEQAVYNEETKHVKLFTRPTLLVVHENQITPLRLATWKNEHYIVFGSKMGKAFEEIGVPTEADGFPNLWYHCDFQAPQKIPH